MPTRDRRKAGDRRDGSDPLSLNWSRLKWPNLAVDGIAPPGPFFRVFTFNPVMSDINVNLKFTISPAVTLLNTVAC